MDGKKKLPGSAAAGDTLKKGFLRLFGERNAIITGKLLRAAAIGGLGFLLAGGEIAFGARPLWLALLACLPDHVPAAAIGITLRLFMNGSADGSKAIVGAVPMMMFAARLFLGRLMAGQTDDEKETKSRAEEAEYFKEGAAIQVILGCAACATVGIVGLLAGGFLLRDLFAFLLALAAQPPLILAYRCAFDQDSRFTIRSEGGQAVIAMSVILSLTQWRLLGFSFGIAAAYFLTLYVSRTGGAMRGGIGGFLFGLVCEPILAPVMGLGGLVSGLLWEKGLTLAVFAGLGISIACDYYAEGGAVLLSPLPDLILGAAAALPILRQNNLPDLFTYAASAKLPRLVLSRTAVAENAAKESSVRLKALTESMESLSGVFYRLSDRMRKPGAAEVRELCDRCFRAQCVKCNLTTVCWIREQGSTSDAMTQMTAAICREGVLHMGDVPDYLAQRCRAMPRIIRAINDAHIDALERAARQDKLEVLALDYRAMADLLTHACRIHAAETGIDAARTGRIRSVAAEMGIVANCMVVIGKRRLQVVAGGVEMGRLSLSPNRIREAFGEELGVTLTPPRFDLENDYVTMTLCTARRYRVEIGRAGCEKAEETVSGDSIAMFENREDYFYALVSDGMGSGEEAALTSQMCTVFLRTMLAAGNPKSVAIEMLNNFIRNRNLECFSTVDLFEMDLLSGHACFVKSGAAPSYILRDGKLFKISSNTYPIGITREIKCEEIRFDLEAGDVVVLLSDGVAGNGGMDAAQGLEDSLWLADMLTFDWKEEDTVQSMCNKILHTAQEVNHRDDDMSVVMMRVEGEGEKEKEARSEEREQMGA